MGETRWRALFVAGVVKCSGECGVSWTCKPIRWHVKRGSEAADVTMHVSKRGGGFGVLKQKRCYQWQPGTTGGIAYGSRSHNGFGMLSTRGLRRREIKVPAEPPASSVTSKFFRESNSPNLTVRATMTNKPGKDDKGLDRGER